MKKRIAFHCLGIFLATLVFMPGTPARDIGNIFCQDEAPVSDLQLENCNGYLIGTLDTLEVLGAYCPDSATSYASIIDKWRKSLSADATLKSLPTAESMLMALEELGLRCPG